MRIFQFVIDGKIFRVEIEDPWAKPLKLTVNGRSYVVEAQSQPLAPSPVSGPGPGARPSLPEVKPSPSAPAQAVGGKVTAPLPGKVLSISVKVGDRVKPGDEVCVLEAMKMEQGVKSPYAGVVKAIPVSPGQTVSHGQALVELG